MMWTDLGLNGRLGLGLGLGLGFILLALGLATCEGRSNTTRKGGRGSAGSGECDGERVAGDNDR
jgi:hypothetical protein